MSTASSASDERRHLDESLPEISEKGFEYDLLPPHWHSSRHFSSIIFWIPHLLLLATYCGVIVTWSRFRPHLREDHGGILNKKAENHWEARFLGTFSEIGDFFNVSVTTNPSPGAEAAWDRVHQANHGGVVQRETANYVRINRAYIISPTAGDPQALTHIHRLHCLHVLWRRWHGQITKEETKARIATEGHDDHCFEILRYALMCDSNLIIKKVGWTGSDHMREGWIDVAEFCKDPELDGVELGDKEKASEIGP